MSRQINTRPDETLRQICTRQADRIEELEAEVEQWAKDYAEADRLLQLAQSAVAEEREACGLIADGSPMASAWSIAAAIRERRK